MKTISKSKRMKEHRDEVELDAEPGNGFTHRNHATFVGGVFDTGASSRFAQDDADHYGRDRKSDSNHELKQDWYVIAEAFRWGLLLHRGRNWPHRRRVRMAILRRDGF